MTYNEIAARLGISRSAVRQHIVEALVYLRTYLKDSLGVTTSYAGFIMLLVGLLLEG